MSTVFRFTNGLEGALADMGLPVSRVLFVAREVGDDSMGHSVLRLARELRRRGKEVEIACGGGALAAEFEGIGARPHVVRGLADDGVPFRAPHALAARMREFSPDLVHAFGRPLAGWAERVSAVTQCPYVLTVMTFAPGGRRERLRGDWERGSIVAVSEELREELVNHDKIPKRAIGVIPIGIALEDYERYATPPGEAPTPVVGMVGPLTPESGCEYFVRAAREIVDRGVDAHFLIAGDGPERGRLRRLIGELRFEKWVTTVEDFKDYRRMIAVLDVCVIPAVQEGLSLNVIEAMACRKPVVATGVGPVCSVVRDGETGFLAPKKDVAAIADKVIQLIHDPELVRRVVDAAYAMVSERFSLERSVQALLTFYSRCIARSEAS